MKSSGYILSHYGKARRSNPWPALHPKTNYGIILRITRYCPLLNLLFFSISFFRVLGAMGYMVFIQIILEFYLSAF